MKPTDITAFASIMMGLGEFYGKNLSKTMIHLYWQALEAYSLSEVKTALKAHICHPDTGCFLPKPADFIRHLEGNTQSQALQAWTCVERAIREIGSYQSVAFDDSFIHAVIEDMGGWVKLCTITLKELPFCSLEFQKRYQGFIIKPPLRYPSLLQGTIESENACKGYVVPEPLLLGNPSQVKAVMEHGTQRPPLVEHSASMQQLMAEIMRIQTMKDPNNA